MALRAAILVAAIQCGLPSTACAQSGNDFITDLETNPAGALLYVWGFIDGTLTERHALSAPQAGAFCVPRDATGAQSVAIVERHIRENPASRHERLARLALRAFTAAWPCSPL